MNNINLLSQLFCFTTSQNDQTTAKHLFQPPQKPNDQDMQILERLVASLIDCSSLHAFEQQCRTILSDAFETAEHHFYVSLAVKLFSIFMRCNFVGPLELSAAEQQQWNAFLGHALWCLDSGSDTDNAVASKCQQWLSMNGTDNDIEFELRYPFALTLSQCILKHVNYDFLSRQPSLHSNAMQIASRWWYIRTLRYHQCVLTNRCPNIQSEILTHCEQVRALLEDSSSLTVVLGEQPKQLLRCQFLLEYALVADVYWKHTTVQRLADTIKRILCDEEKQHSFRYALSSALGKRTKWQLESKPQLFVRITSSIASSPSKDAPAWYLPVDVALDDDTMLNEIAWDEDEQTPKQSLHYLEYGVLLLQVRKERKVNHVPGLSELNVLAYLDAMNAHQSIRDWCVQTSVLLQRCRAELGDHHKQTRCLQQLESIAAHFGSLWDACRGAVPSGVAALKNDSGSLAYTQLLQRIADERLRGIYCTSLQSHWQLQCELADLYAKIGFTQSALTIYESLKHFEKIATCLVQLGRKHDAQQMLMQHLQIHENEDQGKQLQQAKSEQSSTSNSSKINKPYFLCLLGDVTNDASYYEQAWQVSNHRYGRAMRTLSYYHYHRSEFEKCIECARSALAVNSLFPKVWFLLGSASMKQDPPNYDDVIEAFSFVVSIDRDDFESWNNLGAAHMHQENYASALHALQEAGNVQRQNWKIWENVLTCALRLRMLSKSISTLQHLLSLRKQTLSLNPNVFGLITVMLTQKLSEDEAETTLAASSEKPKEEFLSRSTLQTLMQQFDALIMDVCNRLNESSFVTGNTHEHQSPFADLTEYDTADGGLAKQAQGCNIGVSEEEREKRSTYAFQIYEIICIYFEKTLRVEHSIEMRFKQSRMIQAQFEHVCKMRTAASNLKQTFLRVVHVLHALAVLYRTQLVSYQDGKTSGKDNPSVDMNKLQQTLTSIQLSIHRTHKLTQNAYAALEQSTKLNDLLQNLEKMTYTIKNAQTQNSEKASSQNESITSAFSDWM